MSPTTFTASPVRTSHLRGVLARAGRRRSALARRGRARSALGAAARRAWSDESGQALPLLVGAVLMCMLFGVLVVDFGVMFSARREAQRAVDLAALAAAQDLPVQPTDPQFDAKLATAAARAQDYLTRNGFDATHADTTVSVTTSYQGDPAKIEVSAGRTMHWLFGRLFQLPDTTVNALAVAAANAQPRDVVLVLDRSGSMCIDTSGLRLNCPNPPGRSGWQPFDTLRAAADDFGTMLVPTADGQTLDRLGLVTFSSDATVNLSLTNNYGANSPYTSAIAGLVPAGYTNTGRALWLARQELEQHGRPGASKIIVLLSDGYANFYRTGGTDQNPTYTQCRDSNGCQAADDDVLGQARIAANEGMSLYTIGFTNLAGATLLQAVANVGATSGGGGQYFSVTDPTLLRDTFLEISELTNVALIQ